jgi:hypothetical protein
MSTARNPQGTVDSLDLSEILAADTTDGPKVTLYLPSDPTGADSDLVRRTFNALVKQAAGSLGTDASILDPVRAEVEDPLFWREQSRGLAVFASRGFHRIIRIPVEVAESATVGLSFHLLPLAPMIEGSGNCYILALAKNSVRLFDATRNSIQELPLGSIPASYDDVIEDIPERQIQGRSTGRDSVAFHGHGGSADNSGMLTEEFLREVGQGIERELGTARSQPLVLASVEEHLPVFRKVCGYPAVVDEVIPGNPEHSTSGDLRSAAWRIITARRDAAEPALRDKALTEVSAGRGSTTLAEIVCAADEGRVDTLYLPRDPGSVSDAAFADRALAGTLAKGGNVRTLSSGEGGDGVIATYRH